MTTVQIYDRYPLFARGVADALAAEGFRVMVGPGLLRVEQLVRADVLVVDPSVIHGLTPDEFVERVAPIAPVVFVVEPGVAEPSLPPGTNWVVRDATARVLVEAVRSATTGAPRCREGIAVAPEPEDPSVPLSTRERQVLQQIAHGRTHSQIAKAMGISRHTVDTYVKRIRTKLRLGNKAELTLAAVLGGYAR